VPTADAQPVHLAVQNAAEWTRLCADVLERPALAGDERFATNPARVANRQALDQEIARVTTTLTAAELVERLEAAGIAYARMNTMAEFLSHPQLAARGRWRDVDSPAGSIHALVPPVSIDNEAARMDPIPALGAHTDTILRELGYDAQTIAAWRAAGTI
jgi:formyl-CoA transferase